MTARIDIDLERSDPPAEKITLYVDRVEVASKSFGFGPAPAADAAELAAQQVEFNLWFDSDEYDPETGAVTYSNGTHSIVAGVTVVGSEAESFSNREEVEFDNADGVYVAVNGLGAGATNSATGQIWYGGPASMIEITAVPVLYSGGSASSVGIGAFCGALAATDAEDPFAFTPSCKSTSNTNTDNAANPAGDTPEFTIAGADVETKNGDDIFPLYLDFEGPSAPTFYPNPNDREGGWVNLTVDFLGAQNPSSNKDGWLTYNDDDVGGVGGYAALLRYAEIPKGEAGLDAAIAAPILTLANLPGESKENAYCAVASAVDLLGNESALPNAEDHATAAGTCVDASGYAGLLEAADATDATAEALANAGLLVGVDITPPAVEFTAASAMDEATALGDGWTLHVTDAGSGLATDPIDASVEVRNGDGTDKLKVGTDANTFAVTGTGPRFTTTVNGDEEDQSDETDRDAGYYTFAATASDKAGNESASVSRIALHDVNLPDPVRLFAVPGDDDFTHAKTLLATDNLSIAGYYVTVSIPASINLAGLTSPEIRLGSVTVVDEYNESDLMDDIIVRDAVELPFAALQIATPLVLETEQTPEAATPIVTITAYVSDQVGTTAGEPASIDAPATADIPQVTGFRGFDGFVVTATDGKTGDNNTTVGKDESTVTLRARAELPDESTDFPFARVDFYAEVTVEVGVVDGNGTDVTELWFIESVSGLSATVKTVETPGRDWTYEVEIDAADFLAAVDAKSYGGKDSDNGTISSKVVAFGVSKEKDGSVAVADTSENLIVVAR